MFGCQPSLPVKKGDIGDRGVCYEAVLNDKNIVGIAPLHKEAIESASVGIFQSVVEFVCFDKLEFSDFSLLIGDIVDCKGCLIVDYPAAVELAVRHFDQRGKVITGRITQLLQTSVDSLLMVGEVARLTILAADGLKKLPTH